MQIYTKKNVEFKQKGVFMFSIISSINSVVNNFIWGLPAMVCIIGVGLYLSFRTGFVQIRNFPFAIKNTVGKIFHK